MNNILVIMIIVMIIVRRVIMAHGEAVQLDHRVRGPRAEDLAANGLALVGDVVEVARDHDEGLGHRRGLAILPLLNQRNRNPQPQLEPKITSLDKYNINQLNSIRNTSLLNLWGWDRGVPIPYSMCIHMYIYIYMHISISISIYIYIYIIYSIRIFVFIYFIYIYIGYV